jgi:hypothetical protein
VVEEPEIVDITKQFCTQQQVKSCLASENVPQCFKNLDCILPGSEEEQELLMEN